MKTKNSFKTAVHLPSFLVIPLLFLAMLILSQNVAGQNPYETKQEAAPHPPPPPTPSQPDHPSKPTKLYRIIGTDTIYSLSEEMPKFPGGDDAFEKFKSENVKYPPEVKKAGLEGSVRVNFNIEKDGSLSNIRVITGVSPSLDAEALRVTKQLPHWQPGKVNGEPVKFMSGTTYDFDLTSGTLKKKQETGMIKALESISTAAGDEEIPFVMVEEMPMFPGGDMALLKYIAENTSYPASAKANNIQGRVIIRFCVTKEGDVNRISILRGVDPELDSEAMRVIGTLPLFKPGKQGGKAVPVWYMVPITFALDAEMGKGSPSKQEISGYDEAPVFPGGEEALYNFISSNIVYPKWVKEKKITGKVIVNFCINNYGSVEGVMVHKGVDPELDGEAVRVIRMIPEWKPAKLSGNPVHVWYSMPVTFKLD